MFMANTGGISSKRVCGVVGWLVCLIMLGLGFWFQKEIPEFGDYVIITSASLLGVDSLAGIFTKSEKK
jgi:hypothetical protein